MPSDDVNDQIYMEKPKKPNFKKEDNSEGIDIDLDS